MDPITEARRQWVEHGWENAAPGMAAVTSIMRAQQVLLAGVDEKLAEFNLSFARFELLRLLAFTRPRRVAAGQVGGSPPGASDEHHERGRSTRGPRFRRAPPTPHRRPHDAGSDHEVGRRVVERATVILNDEVFSDVAASRERDVAAALPSAGEVAQELLAESIHYPDRAPNTRMS